MWRPIQGLQKDSVISDLPLGGSTGGDQIRADSACCLVKVKISFRLQPISRQSGNACIDAEFRKGAEILHVAPLTGAFKR